MHPPHSGPKTDVALQAERVRDELCNRLLRSIFWVGVLLMPFAIARALATGWLALYAIHLVVAGVYVLLVAFRKRLPVAFKAASIIAIMFGIGLVGLFNLGVDAPALCWLLGSWVVSTVLVSKRMSLSVGVGVMLVMVTAAFGHSQGWLSVAVDLNAYTREPAAWGMLLIGAGGFVVVTFQAMTAYNWAMTNVVKDFMRQWVDGLPLGVLVLDAKGQAYYGNRRLEDTLGLSLQDLPKVEAGSVCDALGATIAGSNTTYPDTRWPLLRALQGSESSVEDIEIVRRGELRRFKVTGKPVRNAKGVVTYAVGSFEDITDRKRDETELQTAKISAEIASQAKSQLLANMNHELRMPINAVLGMMQLLDRTPLTGHQQEYVRAAETASRSLLRAVNDVLDFSQSSSGQLGLEPRFFRTDTLAHKLRNSLQDFVGAKPVQWAVSLDPTLPQVLQGDDVRLAQVLTNLSHNAVKFTPRGTVTLSIFLVEKDAASALIEFSIQDTGIGIAPQDQDKIFTGFYQATASSTRRFGGTGVGLAVADRLVRLMGGTITVASTLGAGSTFSFLLRLAIAPPQSLPEPAPAPQPPSANPEPTAPHPYTTARRLQGLRILVVEDNRSNQLVAKRLLEAEGAEVSLAGDGELGVAAVVQATPGFDAVLMDLQMPVMDGFEAARVLRTKPEFQTLPIIASTANSTSLDKALCLQAGMNDHISKPLELDVLVGIILRHTAQKSSANTPASTPTSGTPDAADSSSVI
jgi:signal transduction histidine kinase/ActR/RegA family two-component response regulator